MIMGTKIPIKVSEASKDDISLMYRELPSFSMPHPRKFHFMSIETVFVAKHQGQIVGFISILPNGGGQYEISGLYTRLGFDRKGIGSKLLGTANSYFISVGAKHVVLTPATGRRLIGNKLIKEWADGFYFGTNYSYNKHGYGVPKFEWYPTRNPRVRKPKIKQKTIQPQNLLQKDAMLFRRSRVRR
jgi:GNAT superfamily N-acetyltransferase